MALIERIRTSELYHIFVGTDLRRDLASLRNRIRTAIGETLVSFSGRRPAPAGLPTSFAPGLHVQPADPNMLMMTGTIKGMAPVVPAAVPPRKSLKINGVSPLKAGPVVTKATSGLGKIIGIWGGVTGVAIGLAFFPASSGLARLADVPSLIGSFGLGWTIVFNLVLNAAVPILGGFIQVLGRIRSNRAVMAAQAQQNQQVTLLTDQITTLLGHTYQDGLIKDLHKAHLDVVALKEIVIKHNRELQRSAPTYLQNASQRIIELSDFIRINSGTDVFGLTANIQQSSPGGTSVLRANSNLYYIIPEPANKHLNQVTILDKAGQPYCLGIGGTAEVFKAVSAVSLETPISPVEFFAVKVINIQGTDPNLKLILRAEIEDQVRRVEHENIIKTYGVGEINGQRCIVMALVNGKTLQEALEEAIAVGHNFIAEKVAELLGHLLRGMSAAHKAHLYHRDLKLANAFLLPAAPHVVVADFGMGKFMLGELLDSRLNSMTANGDVPGTVSYLPPEATLIQQIDKELQGAVTDNEREDLYAGWDLYAIGNMAYRLLTGQSPRQPAEGLSAYFNFSLGQISEAERARMKLRSADPGHLSFQQLVTEKIAGKQNLSSFVPARPTNIPDTLWAIISKLLAYNPYDRFSNCDEALQALELYQRAPQSVNIPLTDSQILSAYDGIIVELVDPNQRWALIGALAGDLECKHQAFEMTSAEILQLATRIETETATETDLVRKQSVYEAVANLRAYAS